jgi:SAM-dependent methyltransferase
METNRRNWDERVPIHLKSEFYGLERFKDGESTLYTFELDDLGPVKDCSLVHLQCHIGLDTLSWARQGASVTGLDFSRPAVEAASALASGLDIPARFVQGNVYDAVEVLGETYDVVYTGRGALIWLPELEPWAQAVSRLLKPGGRFYMHEFHPITEVFAEDSLDVAEDYFHSAEPRRWEGSGTYAEPDAETEHNVSLEWKHTLGDVVSALANAGLRIELLREQNRGSAFRRWPFMVEVAPREFALPPGLPRLPLTYTLLATRPPTA